jgi:hypothetical protein
MFAWQVLYHLSYSTTPQKHFLSTYYTTTEERNEDHHDVTRKMVLKITPVLASGRRRFQARCKDLVKVTVKFIRKGICFQ